MGVGCSNYGWMWLGNRLISFDQSQYSRYKDFVNEAKRAKTIDEQGILKEEKKPIAEQNKTLINLYKNQIDLTNKTISVYNQIIIGAVFMTISFFVLITGIILIIVTKVKTRNR